MAEACFELALERREADDKDHYANKRLKVSGDLMKDLFRTALNKLARDVKYQLERANMRNRQLTVNTVVRSDVLTERLEHPIATGNWVGGRSGVSQLVDRTDFMGVLSHLRRLRSPLSRSQPHFEARDLHATQWGRICPLGDARRAELWPGEELRASDGALPERRRRTRTQAGALLDGRRGHPRNQHGSDTSGRLT